MLEAIIAFFPIREDHDAIGAIDSSVESRKKYAKQSIQYKCDICGPIAKLLKPIENNKTSNDKEKEKEKEKENLNENNNTNTNDNTNNENYANTSNNVNNNNEQSSVTQNKNIKNTNNQKPKIVINNPKKDYDSSSNSSLASNQTGKFKFKRENTNNNLTNNQNNENNNLNTVQNNKQTLKKNNLSIPEEEQVNENKNKYLFNDDNTLIKKNKLYKEIDDEINFNKVANSIIYHGQDNFQTIEKKLKTQIANNIFSNINGVQNLVEDEETKYDMFSGDNFKQNTKCDNKILKKKKFVDGKKICEKKLEENIKCIKYYARKNFEEIRDKNMRNLHIAMIGFMFCVFLLFVLYRRYKDKIERFLTSTMNESTTKK